MENPYATSGINPISQESGNSVEQGVLQALAGTKPWVKFCSIIGFIGTGLMVLAGLFMILAGFISGSRMGLAPMGLLGFAYILIAAIYFIPSLKLWKYGSHIASLLTTNSISDLVAAMEAQRSFWKIVGILVLIVLILYVVFIAIAIFGAVGMRL